jgi:hypothetical protein
MQMQYTCEICGQTFAKPNGPQSATHLKSQRHTNAMRATGVSQPGATPASPAKKTGEIRAGVDLPPELVIYLAIKTIQVPSYSNIIMFGGSFGLKIEALLLAMIQKLKEGDLGYASNIDPLLGQLYQILFDVGKLDYPLTFTVEEAWKRFASLKCKDPEALVVFFKNLSMQYPEMLNLSSTTPGMPEDLITFRRLFPNSILFVGKKRWAL